MGSLDSMRRELERKALVVATVTAADIEFQLRQTSPSDTGEMRQKTTARSQPLANGARINIRVDTPYAHIVAAGQRPHLITEAKPGKFLHNVRTGFSAVSPVRHPGALPRSWWADALRDAPDLLARNWNGLR